MKLEEGNSIQVLLLITHDKYGIIHNIRMNLESLETMDCWRARFIFAPIYSHFLISHFVGFLHPRLAPTFFLPSFPFAGRPVRFPGNLFPIRFPRAIVPIPGLIPTPLTSPSNSIDSPLFQSQNFYRKCLNCFTQDWAVIFFFSFFHTESEDYSFRQVSSVWVIWDFYCFLIGDWIRKLTFFSRDTVFLYLIWN